MQTTEAFNCWLAHLTTSWSTILGYSGLLQNEGERDNKSASALRAGDQAKRYDSDPSQQARSRSYNVIARVQQRKALSHLN